MRLFKPTLPVRMAGHVRFAGKGTTLQPAVGEDDRRGAGCLYGRARTLCCRAPGAPHFLNGFYYLFLPAPSCLITGAVACPRCVRRHQCHSMNLLRSRPR